MSCGVSPFQPYPENVIWLSAGRTVPAGWVETSRFEFDCGAAVVVMPDGYSSGGTIPTAITPPVINFAGNSWNVTPGTYSNYDNIATTVMIGSDVVGLTGVFTAADDGKTMTVSETAYNSYGSISQYANRPVEYDPLAPYYASGTIGIHFATDAVTTDGGGLVTGLHNKGALGSMFDATVTGNPIAISGNALTMTSTSGIVSSATPASLDGVRLMFAVGVDQLANGARFFGHVDGATTWDVLGNINASGVVLQGRYVSGSTTTLTPVPRIALPASGFVLIEVEFTTSQWRTWINGTPATIANSAVPAFLVSNVGIGTTVGNRFIGPFGDVFCVLTGQSDTDAAIAAAKERLNARFGTPT